MKMRLILAAFAAALTLCAQSIPSADAAHAEKVANIRKLMAMISGDKVADQMFDQMAASMKASAGQNGPSAEKFWQEFRKEIDLKKIEDIVVTAYDEHLSAEDVKGLIQFYETPAGIHMLEAMPKINSDMLARIMPLGQEMAQKAMRRMQEAQPR